MIQFNLLPDVKLEYIRTKQRKRMIVTLSIIVTAVALVIFLLLFLFVRVSQPKHMKDLTNDINKGVSTLQNTKDLDKILTIQNQLKTLPGLHDRRVFSSRFVDYLGQVTPAQATIANVDVDFTKNTVLIKGDADSLATVNKFADTLKFTDYQINNSEKKKAFNSVVLQGFTLNPNNFKGQRPVTFQLTFKYDPPIFATVKDVPEGSQPVTLIVPQITSTRSETEKPGLFAPSPTEEQER
jgi:hypothetical protein